MTGKHIVGDESKGIMYSELEAYAENFKIDVALIVQLRFSDVGQ